LARASRSFLIYDPRNAAIRTFLAAYRDAAYQALKDYGEIYLDIRPFEMLREGEIVYLERDRERSLAFRLFRDGVRRLTIETDVEWEELLKLLEILSIRFTGIRQQEDDVVTLLLKAGFNSIQITAVEGFVPDDEEYCGDDPDAAAARELRAKRRVESHVEVPPDWDLPTPIPPSPKDFSYKPISEEELAKIQYQSSSLVLAENTVRLVIEMLKVVADPSDPTEPADVEGLIVEVRDFLLSDGQLSSLLQLMSQLQRIMSDRPEEAKELLASFADQRALQKILRSIPKGTTEPPEDLLDLLNLSDINHLEVLVRMLEIERGMTAREITKKLIAKYAKENLDFGLERLKESESSVAADILDALILAQPDKCIDIVRSALERTEADIQIRSVSIIEDIEEIDSLKEELYMLLSSKIPEIRIRILRLLEKLNDHYLYPTLLRKLQESTEMPLKEAELYGELLAKTRPSIAQEDLQDWTKPRALFSFGGSVRPHQQWAAVTAIGMLPGDENVERLRKLREEAGSDLADHCGKILFKRRKDGVYEKGT
ncbi:MAG: hypothetical protein CMK59_02460, partial [Proteobacteria bacterium]|nr:hypothetical protein [Pseudomonadota bacterium]